MRNIVLLALGALILAPIAGAQTAPATAPATTAPTIVTPHTAPAGVKVTRTPMSPAMPMGAVNVNTASAADLTKIPGISTKIAADVIKNRPYKNSAELVKKVKGIGPKNVKKMLPLISF